jgi:phosphohistidine phosphatase
VRSLILLRHAKSDWSTPRERGDLKRPLSKRGRNAARTMGRFLAQANQIPDSVISSPALRATETIQLAVASGKMVVPVRAAEGLYGDVESVLAEIRKEPDSTEMLLVVGHEPVWSELASLLLGGASLRLPTCSVARIDFEGEHWKDLLVGRGRLAWLVVPRLFPRGITPLAS